MTIGSGLAGQVGISNESVVNTPVAAATFTRFNKAAPELRNNFAQGHGIGGSQLVPLAARRSLVSADAGLALEFDLATKGMGKYFQAMFGSYTTTATQIASSPAYQQIHNNGSADGKTFTCQVGVPSVDGTVNPLTLSGCKVTDWTLTASANALITLALNIDAMQIQPTGAGALGIQSASYSASTALYAFNKLAVSTFSAMTVVSNVWTPTSPASLGVVRNVTLKGGQPKDTSRWQAGSTTKAEALVNADQPITGQIDIDFANMTLYTAFAANNSIGLSLQATGADAGGSNPFTVGFVLPACFLEQGSTPKVNDQGVVTVQYPFTALDDGTNGAIQAVIISTDTAV